MRKQIRLVGALGWVLGALFLLTTAAAAQTPSYVDGEVIVKFAPGVSTAQAEDLFARVGAEKIRDLNLIGASLVHLNDMTVEEAVARYEGNALIEYIVPNRLWSLDATIPNDTDFSQLWGMHNTGQTGGTPDADIDAPEAWDTFTGSHDIIVGVIDTGVDYNHPDLAANIWTNVGEIPGNGIDDDGNGWIDDIHGWDAYNNDADPMDDHNHGTHCSGTIGGVGNNALGVAGVSWNVRIMALKFLSSGGSGPTSAAIDCLEYAIANGANLTSNSWGGGSFDPALEDAIAQAGAAGQLFVAAAGNSSSDNDSYPHYPSSYTLDNIVAVGATDHNDNIAGFSCFGATSVDIGAPGEDIYSTLRNGTYGTYSGTSMATPHVAGALALLEGAFPGITPLAAKNVLMQNSDAKPQFAGRWVSGGRLNISMMLTGPDTIPPYPVLDLAVLETASNWVDLTWTASGDDGPVGDATLYDIRFATFPIDSLNFGTATRWLDAPEPEVAGTTEVGRVPDLAVGTTYWFALKVIDDYGNTSGISNTVSTTTLPAPTMSVSPASFTVDLDTGQQAVELLTVANTGVGVLDFEVQGVPVTSTAQALAAAAAAVIDGIEFTGSVVMDGIAVPVLDAETEALVAGRLQDYRNSLDLAGIESTTKVVGVGGPENISMIATLMADPQLAAMYQFEAVDYLTDDLSQIDGLIIAEYDFGITSVGAAVLLDFYNSGRPIMLGMDDFDDIWYGDVAADMAQVFGISSPYDAEFCSTGIPNALHPIMLGIPSVQVGSTSFWCNDNDAYDLDGADWLWRDSVTGNYHGVAKGGRARTVLFGEYLQGIWAANPVMHANAVIWMFEGSGVPTVDPAVGSLAAGESIDLQVTFDATGLCTDTFLSELRVSGNDPAQPTVAVPAEMNVTGYTDIDLSGTGFDFGQVFVGGTRIETLRVDNPGCEPLEVYSISFAHGDFAVDVPSFVLDPGRSREVYLAYSPTSVGPATATATIVSNDPDEGTLTLALQGEGLAAPALTYAPTSMSASLVTGQRDTQILTIGNTGGSDLEFSLRAAQPGTLLTVGPPEGTSTVIFDGEPAASAPEYAAGLLPSREPMALPEEAVPSVQNVSLDLLFVGTSTFPEITPLLLAYSDINSVDYFSASGATPTLADLQPYDVVIVGNGNPWYNPSALGDVLADYIDQGGGVIQTVASFASGFEITGRFLSGGYGAFGTGYGPIGSGTLATFDPAHPIMAGATTAWCDAIATAPLQPGAEVVAAFDVGEPMIATQGTQVVGFNSVVWSYGYWFGDVPLLLHNAALWTSGRANWLTFDPGEGVIPPGGSMDIEVVFDAAELCTDVYLADLLIENNDPLIPVGVMAAEMAVQGVPDIAVSDSLVSFGEVFLGGAAADTLVVGNPGCELLIIGEITTDDPQFAVSATGLALNPGTEELLVVTYTPAVTGVHAAVLTLVSDDPDQPEVLIPLDGECVLPPVAGISPSSLAVTLLPGGMEERTLTITNSGSADLVWSLSASSRDSVGAAMAAAGAAVAEGLERDWTENADGEPVPALTAESLAELESRLADYRATATAVGADDVLPVIAVGGYSAFELIPFLLSSPDLSSKYVFEQVDFASADLSDYAGLILAETDASISEPKAQIIHDFWGSGRPVMLGMDDLDSNWSGGVPVLLEPVFGLAQPFDSDLCQSGTLNPNHPINEGIPGFTIGGSWCNDNDAFDLTTADWVFRDGATGDYFGIAASTSIRSVLMGENLAWIWSANAQLNAAAVIWMMEGGGLPRLDPKLGVLPPGGSQEVTALFDATDLCGGVFLSDINLDSNDPVNPRLVVPADLTVLGEPDIAIADTLLDFGQVYVNGAGVRELTISNRACGLLDVTSITSDNILFTPTLSGVQLGGSETVAIPINFEPTAPGSFSGTLTVLSNDPDEPVLVVPMVGTAVLGPEIEVDPTSFLVELDPGGSDTRTMTIANNGDADLEWEIRVSKVDSMSAALRAAAAALTEGLVPATPLVVDGAVTMVLGPDQREVLESRLPAYEAVVDRYRTIDALQTIGVGGGTSVEMFLYLVSDPTLSGMYAFEMVNYVAADLSGIDGLVLSEPDYAIDLARAQAIFDFQQSGRPVFLGMDDLDDVWYGAIPSLLGPVFGITGVHDANLCSNAIINAGHPILEGITSFSTGGYWCNDNDYYSLGGADWLFGDGSTNWYFGIANEGVGRTVLMGEHLIGIWYANEQLNVNAVIWMMEGSGLPSVAPRSGTLAAGGQANVTLTFTAPDNCGSVYLSVLDVLSNDPVNPDIQVPAQLVVPGEPNIAVSDSLLEFGPVFVGYDHSRTLTVFNRGCDVLDVTSLTISPAEFTVDTTPFMLPVGGSRALEVVFTPTGAGETPGTLILASNDADQPALTVDLAATGLYPPAIAVQPEELTATLAPESTAMRLLTVGNTGLGDLTFQLRTASNEDLGAALSVRPSGGVPTPSAADRTLDKSGAGAFASFPGMPPALPQTTALAAMDSTVADLDILVLGSGQLADFLAELRSQPGVASAEVFDTQNQVPVLDDLLPFHVVILANNNPFDDPVATGDVVADFADLGGGVVQTEPSFVSGYNLQGRFWDEGYSAFTLGANPTGVADLGAFVFGHPIFDGVSSAWGDMLCETGMAQGAMWVADWDDGRLMVATKGAKVVGVNAFVAYPDHWGGGVVRLIANAAQWVAGTAGWLDLPVTAGEVAPGGSLDLEVIFDPKSLPEGVYTSEIIVSSNDPAVGDIVVPVTMEVTGAEPIVRIDAAVGALSDLENILGARPDATDGYDGTLDIPEPSPPPSNYLSAYFPHPEWQSPLGPRFRTDYRAMFDPVLGSKSWDFRVETDQADSVALTFTPSFGQDTGWQIWLLDHATGQYVDLWQAGLRHVFEPSVYGKDFTVIMGRVLPPVVQSERMLPAGWALIGAPLVPPPGADSWADVLLDDTSGTVFLFGYEGDAGYAAVDGASPALPGQGLWVASTDSFTWTMEGEPTEEAVEIELREGWNLLGYPLWFEGGLSGVQVMHGGSTHSWAEAYLLGLVSGIVYDYNTTLDDYFSTVLLDPWRGYWLAAHQPGVVLSIDPLGMATAEPMALAETAARTALMPDLVAAKAKTAEQADKSLLPWRLTVGVAGSPAAAVIGRDTWATEGFDAAFDLPSPPASPSGAARTTLDLLHPEWGLKVGDRFASDLRGLTGDEGVWELTLTPAASGTVTLTWDILELPTGIDLQVYLPAENRVLVPSIRQQGTLELETGGRPVTVAFRAPDVVSDVPWEKAGLQLRNVPNPFNPSTEFMFNLPKAGVPEVRIYDLRGHLVEKVVGGVEPAGPTRLRWSGRSRTGSEAASGVYFYRLFLDGKQLGGTHKMSLVK